MVPNYKNIRSWNRTGNSCKHTKKIQAIQLENHLSLYNKQSILSLFMLQLNKLNSNFWSLNWFLFCRVRLFSINKKNSKMTFTS